VKPGKSHFLKHRVHGFFHPSEHDEIFSKTWITYENIDLFTEVKIFLGGRK